MEMTTSVKGTVDLYGKKAVLYHYIVRTAQELARNFSFDHIELPILEHLQLFLRGIGEDTDVVSKELFSWEDKSSRKLCLRPEGTAQTVRFLLEQGLTRESLMRYFYIGSMFRAEKPQKGRQREFHQIGVEVFGEKAPSADVDVILFAVMLLEKLDISNFILQINSVGCQDCRPQYLQILKEYLIKNKDSLCKICQDRIYTNPLRVLDCKHKDCQEIISAAPSILDYLCDKCKDHFMGIQYGLNSLDIRYMINVRLVRGLDYYTQTAFEITLPNLLGSQDAVCGGGRYNDLVKVLSEKEDIPAVGLALGVERLMLALEALEKDNINNKPEIAILSNEKYNSQVLQYIYNLRKLNYSTYYDSDERALGKKITKANKIGVQYILIINEEEYLKKEITLKNMKTGKQITDSWDSVIKGIQLI